MLTSVSFVFFSTHLCFLHLSAHQNRYHSRDASCHRSNDASCYQRTDATLLESAGKNASYWMLVAIRAVMPSVQSQ